MTTADKALFIASRVHVIANREDAGRCLADVRWMVEAIEKAVNRKPAPKYCGNCPTPLDEHQRMKLIAAGEVDDYGLPRAECATPLYEDNRESLVVTCWRCKHTYNIKQLFEDAIEGGKGLPYSERDVLSIMAQIGRPIPRGTWWSWVRRGAIENRREWSAEPGYFLEDAQALWEERVGKRKAAM